jgi:hypothetical protein
MAWQLALFLLQGPAGEGWNLQTTPREVQRVYLDLLETTEVSLLLLPGGPEGEPLRVNMLFQAFFPGRAERDPYSKLPPWPKGAPERVTMTVRPLPLTVLKDTSLRLVVDGETFDLGESCGPLEVGGPCQVLYSGSGIGSDSAIVGISAEIQPALLQRLAQARGVTGTALGFPILLSSNDVEAVSQFAERVHWKVGPQK